MISPLAGAAAHALASLLAIHVVLALDGYQLSFSSTAEPDHPELHDIKGITPTPSNGNVTESQLQAAINIFNTPQRDGGWNGELPTGILPGFGQPYTEDDDEDACGSDFPVYCDGCGGGTIVGRTCYRATCPRCASMWAVKRAAAVAARVARLRSLLDYRHDNHIKIHHIVVSPPSDWQLQAGNPLDRTNDTISEIANTFDMPGVYFYHSYAGKNGDDRGFWKQLLFSGRTWDDASSELKYRPHFHGIVVTDKVPGGDAVDRIQNETGWTIHRITPNDDTDHVSIYDDLDLARAVTYCISHTTILEREHTTSAQYRDLGSITQKDTGSTVQWTQEVTVPDDVSDHHDAMVRSVAPLTLDVAPARLTCERTDHDHDDAEEGDEDDPVAPDHTDYATVDVEAAAATIQSRRGRTELPNSPSSTSLPQTGADLGPDAIGMMQGKPTSLPDSGTPVETTSSTPDQPTANTDNDADDEPQSEHETDSQHDDPDAGKCRGRYLPITHAPKHLKDPDWRARAPHWQQLAAVYLDWRQDRDWQQHLDDPPDDHDGPPPD